jgi:HAD superfamily hydrolase (TIGR01549 family)
LTIKAVIFDLDGTLATFNLNYKNLRADARSLLLHAGVPSSVISTNESIFEMLKKTEVFFKKTPESFEKNKNAVLAIAEKYELEAAASTSLLSGAVETLKNLKEKSTKVGLCTISSGKSANFILQRFKIGDFFDAVVPRECVRYVKPHPEQIELALKALGVKAAATLFVGDSIGDMQAAKDAGALAVGFPNNFCTPKELIEAGADYIITSLTDLPVLIEKINQA